MNRDLERLSDELKRSLEGLEALQTQLRPKGSDGKWTIQQIVRHLLLTYAETERAMDARIAKGTATKAIPSILQRTAQFTILNLGYFPHGRRAPDTVTAPLDEPPAAGGTLISDSSAAVSRMDCKVAAAEAIFGGRYRSVSHMILGPLSTGQWGKFHLLHGRHHIRQIAAIRRDHNV